MSKTKQYYIELDSIPVKVTEEVYRAYKRPIWRERKRRKVRAKYELSLDMMCEGIADPKPLLENQVTDNISLSDALATLSDGDRRLIEALFYECMTEREKEEKTGISQKNVNKKNSVF
jgi:DNA-directed RNA polymerase specialized sigma24 family protein